MMQSVIRSTGVELILLVVKSDSFCPGQYFGTTDRIKSEHRKSRPPAITQLLINVMQSSYCVEAHYLILTTLH